MSALGILAGLAYKPGEAQQEAAARPRVWWVPALLLVLGAVLVVLITGPYQVTLANERTTQMLERITAKMTEEQARTVREASGTMTLQRYQLTTLVPTIILAGLGWVLRGAVVHFSSMALGGTSAWGPTFAVSLWCMLPFFVRDVLLSAYVLLNQKVVEHQGLSFLVATGDWLKNSSNLMYALLSSFDPFVLWHLLLFGLGIAVATRLGRAKAFVLAVLVWAVFTAVKLIPMAIGSSVMGRVM